MAEIREDWAAAPKDGTVIFVKFSEGPPVKARWNPAVKQWQVLRKKRPVEVDGVRPRCYRSPVVAGEVIEAAAKIDRAVQ